jgi:hypothetical protein
MRRGSDALEGFGYALWFWLRGKCSGKGKNKQRQKRNAGILRCARNDSVKQTTVTAKTEADPCGMTNKRTSKDNGSRNGFGSVFSLASFSVVG